LNFCPLFLDGKGRQKTMKVKVEPDICTGDEICTQVCPEIFEMQGDKAIAKMEEVPQDLKDSVREVADSCPSEAIIVEE
jgi:ferredoxin